MMDKDDNIVKITNDNDSNILLSRCTFKILFQGREVELELCVIKMKEFFKQL